jgi:alkanesulfonate monooxygenase
MSLLSTEKPITYEGRYYRVKNLRLVPPMPPNLLPGLMVSGSSEAGLAAARATGAIAVQYPRPPEDKQETADMAGKSGVRIGLIAVAGIGTGRDRSIMQLTPWKVGAV